MAYGWQTRSWRHSTEKRQLDKELRELASQLVLLSESVPCEWGMCTCLEKRFAHPPHRRELATFDAQHYAERHAEQSTQLMKGTMNGK